mgnify:CR=1 FL=1
MTNEKLDNLFYNIKTDCMNLIKEKDVSLEELSFALGISSREFISNFQARIKDFSFYLETYRILIEW